MPRVRVRHLGLRTALLTALVLAACATLAPSARAQSAHGQPAPVGECSYEHCALGISPVWNGLLVTQGVEQKQVANLGFFWTRSLDEVFAGTDSALAYGRRAVKVRRTAAILTDLGALALGFAAVRAAQDGSLDHGAKAVAIAGVASFGASVPLQFAADGLLSRAIWWRNARYAR